MQQAPTESERLSRGGRTTVRAREMDARRTLLHEVLELLEEARNVDDYAVADQALAIGVHQAARQEMEVKLLLVLALADNDRVAGVVAAGTAGADVRGRGEDVDELALALVAPLGAEAASERRGKPSVSKKDGVAESFALITISRCRRRQRD